MKTAALLLTFIAFALKSIAVEAPADAVKQEQAADLKMEIERQAAARAAVDAEFKGRMETLKKWYPTALDALEKEATARGNLEDVLAIKKERERMDRALTTEERLSLIDSIKAVRQKYEQGLATLATQQRTREIASIREYVQTLQALQKKLTTHGDIESALGVRKETVDVEEKTRGPLNWPICRPIPLPHPNGRLQSFHHRLP